MTVSRHKRVVIVGGGVAGLAAAHELRRLDPRVSIRLLEARQLLGGRVHTQRDPLTGEPLELGAEFVHGRPPSFLRILRQARIPIEEGDDGGESEDSPFAILPKLLAPLLGSDVADTAIDTFLRRQKLPAHELQMLRGYVQGFYVAPPKTASARAIARMEVAAAAIQGERAAQFPRGYDALAGWLAKALGPDELRLGAVATEVVWRPGGVKVQAKTLAGARLAPIAADAAVVAVPFPALRGGPGGLGLRPKVAEKSDAANALRMGHATKVFLRFDSSVKSESFFFGHGPIPVWWTAADPHTRWLVGWAGGAAAEALDRKRDAAVLADALTSVAGPLERSRPALARALTGFRWTPWSREPFIEGAYAYVPLGADGAMASLARPVADTLFFAGEATNPEHAGTVHGAYESGVRAARELLGRLP